MFASCFVYSGSSKSIHLSFLKSIRASPKMPPKPVPIRWASTLDAVAYHKEFFQYEKSFVDLEEDRSRFQPFLKATTKC